MKSLRHAKYEIDDGGRKSCLGFSLKIVIELTTGRFIAGIFLLVVPCQYCTVQ